MYQLMSSQQDLRVDITYHILLSTLGLFLIFMLTLFPPAVPESFVWRKPLIGTTFSMLCILGILAVISPRNCSKILQPKKQNNALSSENFDSCENSVDFKGHHSTCGKYSDHVFQLLGKTRCAACIGLLFGALLALAGSVLYFFVGLTVSDYSLILVFLGSVGTVIGLFQFAFRGVFRMLANTVFVISAFLVLVSVDSAVGGLFFDLFVVCLIVFWLFARISLSKWDHERICSGCETENCSARP